MRHRISLAVLLGLAACSDTTELRDVAEKCGVTEAELKKGKEDVAALKPYSSRQLGKCHLMNDDAHNVLVVTLEIQRSVEKMIAAEKAEAKK